MEKDELSAYLGKPVVVDTSTSMIYIGTLSDASGGFLTLVDVDVHDANEGGSTKEVYMLEARKFGIKKNRTSVKIRAAVVISISLLEDVIEY